MKKTTVITLSLAILAVLLTALPVKSYAWTPPGYYNNGGLFGGIFGQGNNYPPPAYRNGWNNGRHNGWNNWRGCGGGNWNHNWDRGYWNHRAAYQQYRNFYRPRPRYYW